MYGMVDKEFIRKKYFVDGWSIREISRNCKISRQTVRKLLENAEIPKYRMTQPRKSPIMDPWKPVIEKWLLEDQKPGVSKKQRHTVIRIYERLREEFGETFDAAPSTVSYWVRSAGISGNRNEVRCGHCLCIRIHVRQPAMSWSTNFVLSVLTTTATPFPVCT
jgi:transposase